jgi:ATP-binding cassette subfamily C protein CydD
VAVLDQPSTAASPPPPVEAAGRRGRRGHGSGKPKAPKIPLADPIKGQMRAGLIGTWTIALATAGFLIVVGQAVDDVITDGSVQGSTWIGLVGFALLRGLLNLLVPFTGFRAAGRLEQHQRDRVFRSIMTQGTPARSQEQTGKLVATGTQSVELSSVYYATFLGPIIASMTTPIVVLVVIGVFLDARTALTLAVIVPAIPLTVGLFQRGFQKVSDDFTRQSAALSAQFLDAMQGLATLKLFNQGRVYGARIAAAAETVRKSIMRILLGNQIILFVVDTVFSLGMVTAVTWLAMVRLRDGAITPGEAVALVLLGLLLIEPLDKVAQFFYVGMSGIAAGRDIRKQLMQPAAVPDAADARDDALGDGSLAFEDVSFSYVEGVPVLDRVSFSLAPGEKVAVVGPSGSGKTTVANLAMRFLAPDSGTVRVGGQDAGSVTGDWVRSNIALVAQSTFLFTGTLRDNLKVAAPDASDVQLRTALADADLTTFVDALPNGLDTQVGERGLAVSGGQAQRIAIARAFLKDAPILVLDEPTSNIDVHSEAAIVAAIDRLSVGRTVLVIAHRLSTVAHMDRVVVLEAGRVTESGSHDELVSAGGHYARAVRRSAGLSDEGQD